MEASIDERHLKDFLRLLQCASRFGDELCISANKDCWEMAVTNSTKSAYCLFKLQPRFFSRWKALGSPRAQRRGVQCQLLVKAVLAVLGKASAVNAIERLDLKIHDPAESLRMTRRDDSTEASGSGTTDASRSSMNGTNETDDGEMPAGGRQSALILRLLCKHGIQKKHSLYLAHSEFMRAEVDPNSTPSGFSVPAKTLRDWLDHFSLSTTGAVNIHGIRPDNQLGWLFGKNEVRIKSWEGTSKGLCTELKLEAAEFGSDADGERYWLESEEGRVDLTIPMKEFSAALQLADALNIDLAIAFSQPSQPLTMIYARTDDDDFDIFCAIATTTCDAFQGVELKGNTRGGGTGGGGSGRGGAGAGGAGAGGAGLPASVENRFPPGISRETGKRFSSDLTDVDPRQSPPPRAGPANGGDAGAGPGSSSSGRRTGQQGRTPSRSRGRGRLDLTPARDVTGGSQRPNGGVSGSQGHRHAPVLGHGGAAESEPLFLPAPSQEEQEERFNQAVHDAIGATQSELAEMLDDADEDDYEQKQKQLLANGQRKAKVDDSMELDDEEDGTGDQGDDITPDTAGARELQRQAEEEERISRQQQEAQIRADRATADRFEPDEDIFAQLTQDLEAHRGHGNGHGAGTSRSGPSRTRTVNNPILQTPVAQHRTAARSVSSTDAYTATDASTSRPSRVPDTVRPSRSTLTGSNGTGAASQSSSKDGDDQHKGSPRKRRASASRPDELAPAMRGAGEIGAERERGSRTESRARTASRSKSHERRRSERGDVSPAHEDPHIRQGEGRMQDRGRTDDQHRQVGSRTKSRGRSRSKSRGRTPSIAAVNVTVHDTPTHRRRSSNHSHHSFEVHTPDDPDDPDDLDDPAGESRGSGMEDDDGDDPHLGATQHESQMPASEGVGHGSGSGSSRSFQTFFED